MNTLSRTTALVLSTSAVLLAACGGGGDDPAQPSAQLITTKEQVLEVFNAMGIGPDSPDILGIPTDFALSNFVSSAATVQSNCSPMLGNRMFSLTDADGNGRASAGDTVVEQQNDCVGDDGELISGTATLRLTAVNTLAGYVDDVGTGGFAGIYNYGTLPVNGYTITGDVTLAESQELRSGMRTYLFTYSAPQLTFTGGPAGTFSVTSLFVEEIGRTLTRFERTTDVNVLPGGGKLEFSVSVVEPIRDVNGFQNGVLLLRNQGVDIRVTLSATGFSAAVDNGRDGSVEHTFTFTLAELNLDN
jgi:hypothetical protein